MKKIYLFIFIQLLVFSSCKNDDSTSGTTSTPTPATKPNILLIIADDMGLDATPGFNEGTIKPAMPHLQSFVANGVTFTNLWSAPTCTPTRASILTGKYGIKTGVLAVGDVISASETSLQAYIDSKTTKSYAHAIVGKWHLSDDPNSPTNMGIDYYAGLLNGSVPSYWDWQLTENAINTQSTTYTTTKFTDLAIDWIDAQDTPWFLWLAYNAPHTPFHLPPTDLHSQGDLPTDDASINANSQPYYMAALEAMDTEIGRLLDAMSPEELANTTIIFIGDNGTPNQVIQSPYSTNKAKGSLFQGGINVPMIVSGYGVDRIAIKETAMINTVDLYATIADIAGAGSSDIHNSVSFKSLLTDANATQRTFTYAEVEGQNKNGYTIRDETYKLIVFTDGNERFYNLNTDPYETTNLLNGAGLTDEEATAKTNLEVKVAEIRQ